WKRGGAVCAGACVRVTSGERTEDLVDVFWWPHDVASPSTTCRLDLPAATTARTTIEALLAAYVAAAPEHRAAFGLARRIVDSAVREPEPGSLAAWLARLELEVSPIGLADDRFEIAVGRIEHAENPCTGWSHAWIDLRLRPGVQPTPA